MDTASHTPTTWSWKCHKCNQRYPMACTQRCLACSHTICSPSEMIEQDSEGSCSILFDLPSWRKFYTQRRELMQQNSSNEEQQTGAAGEAPEQLIDEPAMDNDYVRPEWLVKMINGTHNCFTDCNFPSECFFKLALERVTKFSNKPMLSLSQPTIKTLLRTPTVPKKHKDRGRDGFQKVPSPLSQEWHIDTVSDET